MGPGTQLDGRYKTKKLACWRDDIRECSMFSDLRRTLSDLTASSNPFLSIVRPCTM